MLRPLVAVGLLPLVLAHRGRGRGGGSPAESSTVIAIRIGRPHSRVSASLMSGASRPSRTRLPHSLGTASRAVSATSAKG